MKKVLKYFLICFITAFCLFGFWIVFEVTQLPQLPDELDRLELSSPTIIYAADGRPFFQVRDRTRVTLDQMSPYFIRAVLAIEDKRFFEHEGLDKFGLIRAILFRGKHGGGSTITQQLAKNLFLSFEKTYRRKLRDILLALQFERRYAKNEILQAYCNQINFGSGAFGVENAAMTYFGKHASELDLTESVLLAAIPQLPSYYNPYIDETRVKNRYFMVLERMKELGWITDSEYEDAASFSFTLKNLLSRKNIAPHFIELIKQHVINTYGEDVLNYGGLQIYTTIDLDKQEKAVQSVQEGLTLLDARLGREDYRLSTIEEKPEYPQGALVVLDNSSGAVRAMVGGRDSAGDYFNRAWAARRSPGSAFKPIVYLTSFLELGVDGATVMTDSKVSFDIPGGEYTPRNFEREFYGPIALKYAFKRSVNTIAAQLIHDAKPEKVVEMAARLGVQTQLEPVLSLALGSNGVSVLELASVYSTIASQGMYSEPYYISRIETSDGTVLENNDISQPERVIDQEKMYLVIDLLKGVLDPGGTGGAVRARGFRLPAGGKTGTTNDTRDAWFAGITPEYSVVSWVGYDDFRPIVDKNRIGITGSAGALPIWTLFMKKIENSLSGRDFPVPPGITFKYINLHDGTEVPASDPNGIRVAVLQ